MYYLSVHYMYGNEHKLSQQIKLVSNSSGSISNSSYKAAASKISQPWPTTQCQIWLLLVVQHHVEEAKRRLSLVQSASLCLLILVTNQHPVGLSSASAATTTSTSTIATVSTAFSCLHTAAEVQVWWN